MTRRRQQAEERAAARDRQLRIDKLIDRGWIRDASEIPADARPVDPDRINLGGSWDRPTFFRDQPFTCQDCGVSCVWKAEDQQWYFETLHAPCYETAKRCRSCRRKERERKAAARVRAGHAPSPAPPETP